MIHIIHAKTVNHYDQARKLFRQYAASLGFNLEFQEFDEELASLPGEYSPPGGCILLAKSLGSFFGCVALRKIDNATCEMKRLYVVPGYRGKGIGRDLAGVLIKKAYRLGYKRMLLDTVAPMKEANALYASLGFQPIGAYRYNPLEHAIYYELHLCQVQD